MSLLSSVLDLADAWGEVMWQALLQSTICLAVVTLLWWVLRKRCSAHLGHALFLLPLIPLTFSSLWGGSVSIPVPSSWQSSSLPILESTPAATIPIALSDANPALAPEELGLGKLPLSNASPELPSEHAGQGSSLSWMAWAFLAWVLAASALLIAFARAEVRTWRLVRQATEFTPQDRRRIRGLMTKLNAPRNIEVWQSKELASPSAWGLRRRVILLPQGLLEELDDQQLAWILGHELAHHSRFDLGISWAHRLLQILWFFNPLMWWHSAYLCRIREYACDERALAQVRLQGQNCARLLVQVAGRAHARQPTRLSFEHLYSEKKTMTLRIQRLLNPSRSPRAGMTPVATLFLAAAAILTAVTLNPEAMEGTTKTQTPISQAQLWLLDQQLPDGHWPSGPGFDQPTGEVTTVGVTAFALMALEKVDTDSIPAERHSQAVQLGLEFLKPALEDPKAHYGGELGFRALASHAIALEAWLRAQDQIAESSWKKTAQAGIDVLLAARNPYSGWGYAFEPNGDRSSYYTAFALRALWEAKNRGFDIQEEHFFAGRSVMVEFTNKNTGRTRFNDGYEGDVRIVEKQKSHPVHYTELATALALTTRAKLGDPFATTPEMMLGLSLLATKPPATNEDNSSVDYYYWFYGTEAMSLAGGVMEEGWNSMLRKALMPHQILDEDGMVTGAFQAVDAWSHPGATVHATALAALALQAAAD
jgi:beta-lactamase regulating signal transducer with metallopeptidase domain